MSRFEEQEYFLHGGDYNPDQWLAYPEVIEQDFKLMRLANTNTFSIGIFAWSSLEPTEGNFQFEWLDKIIDGITNIGGNIILATPSGARPAWLSKKYPEVLRTNERREKMLHGGRHNHCLSSPIYREKVAIINEKLAERYSQHPSLLLWHISNEYSGDCHCEGCQAKFREWLKAKYETLEALNEAWWGPFWSHSFTEWEQIESPSSIGESMVHGLNLDWRRFVTDLTIDFYKHECQSIKKYSTNVPITTNFMADTFDLIPFQSLDYSKFAKHVDVISWDCYPAWHNDWETTADLACKVGFINDMYRSMKQKPFLIMECTPSLVNWHEVNKAKRPGMHLLSSMQLIAHGSDSILYFQWRQSRGSSEKFHGAVVGHDQSTENRVFKEVQQLGERLKDIKEIHGANKDVKVAIMYDWDNNWALNDAQGFAKDTKRYPQTLQEHYRYFWERDIAVDIVTPGQDLSKYELVIAPMLYLITEQTIQQLTSYVQQGGKLVSTYLTGFVNEHDLTYLGGWPKQLQELFGIKLVETDTLFPTQKVGFTYDNQTFEAKDYCSIAELQTATVKGQYTEEFYKETPAITHHQLGKGEAYYIAARSDAAFLQAFYDDVVIGLNIPQSITQSFNASVSIQSRTKVNETYYFIMNFSEQSQSVELSKDVIELNSSNILNGELLLAPYEVKIVKIKDGVLK